MTPEDYLAHDAIGLADLIRRREVSALEVLEAALARTADTNPKVNAVIRLLEDEARAAAAGPLPDGPLAGVPYLIKDLGALMKGVPTTIGSRLFQDNVPAADSAVVAGYRRAGLVLYGKTNTPEFGLEPVTEPELFGPSRNPWDLDRTPGGSSGGASAAVAAGMVPAAHASDGGGSIRTPASCCGLFGLKPSKGRVSFAPSNEGWGGFSIQHAVTRTVRDSAALLDAICQPQPGDPYWLEPPATPFLAEVGRDPGRLRIGVFTGAINTGGQIDAECVAAVEDAARLCESLGHAVEPARLPDIGVAAAAAGQIIGASIAATIAAEEDRRGRAVEPGEIDMLTQAMLGRGKAVGGPDFVRALYAAHAYGRQVAALFETFDIFLCSTLGSPAIRVGELRGQPLDLAGYASRLFAFMPNTQAFNITGQPAMTVPLAWSRSGLPIGVQFAARAAEEALLFRLAGQLEQVRPWANRRPAGFQ
ncbi:amidase [Caulobacter sp. KR2-114]|uniref:amidase n=1 Tax=Caulobacter sp. KR2-114 TaxID=3400912 RepID=UPI003BFC5E5B